jgi:peroxiredoxin
MDTLIKVGEPAPNFTLSDLHGKQRSLSDYYGWIVVINFWSAECPWSARTDVKIMDLLSEWDEDVLLLTIAPNASEPLEILRRVAIERGLNLVLPDPDQRVATLFGARTTPHIFLIDMHGLLRYQGAFDDTTFRQRIPKKQYLRDALDAVMNGEEPDPGVTSAYGCAILRYAP